ncbi:chemotaxis protein MotB [Geoalkalibacter ferrihydriticus]|uniref:Flagellar motor protein MotB n=2 Tax=Geoalkalibacter ferrihydriticus TaxID=392333 RepID=A0A0C2HKG7_9BACT|nr:flagellar motor protein MotB [Geoalkalibacter ferrihydriticus]KIH77561.1 flagellar motor protein MotB [Geoalkalibacter ferrihydriticus DSM 17813]SDL68142.1 chemotaxis protein MotB [Geoalkalibacter ferrihydriticus]
MAEENNNGGAKKKKRPVAAGAPLWMVTYSDMVTLLLTFFVLLLSMAQLDQMKFKEVLGSLQGAFGVMASSNLTTVERPRIVEFLPIEDDYTARLYKRLIVQMQRLKLDRDITLVQDRGAVVLRVNDAVLFEAGQTEVRSEAYPVLRKVAEMVRPLPFNLRIEGHTDSVPVSRPGLSNWDYSVARAVSVLKFFGNEDLLPLERLAAVGYGEKRPLGSNDTAEGRALNRRVEFVLESTSSSREELPYLIDAREQMPF